MLHSDTGWMFPGSVSTARLIWAPATYDIVKFREISYVGERGTKSVYLQRQKGRILCAFLRVVIFWRRAGATNINYKTYCYISLNHQNNPNGMSALQKHFFPPKRSRKNLEQKKESSLKRLLLISEHSLAAN
jgi:hypothetical protein